MARCQGLCGANALPNTQLTAVAKESVYTGGQIRSNVKRALT